jgi:hypothetical protein
MDLVEDRKSVAGEGAQGTRRGGDLLVGDRHSVDVARQRALARAPLGLEMEAEVLGRVGPLQLEVPGGRHHHEP